MISPSVYYKVIGSSAEIHCRSKKELTWYYSTGDMLPNVVISDKISKKDILSIKDITIHNSGIYTCRAKKSDYIEYVDYCTLMVERMYSSVCLCSRTFNYSVICVKEWLRVSLYVRPGASQKQCCRFRQNTVKLLLLFLRRDEVAPLYPPMAIGTVIWFFSFSWATTTWAMPFSQMILVSRTLGFTYLAQ